MAVAQAAGNPACARLAYLTLHWNPYVDSGQFP